ncbi:5-bromo-4-chloroindolyl phosphate hydrolysis family protein [Loktanella sp. TSTF-M6]|uniref:5-bromo-4-chloroindolyl phosphate hydrolysis family protein n=1 Tax=Loktanella gaetbuli TaxID=2881335 RepID=A0ABS8BUV9_9RHOB|nr:5-bromo-4-chloroindolyl phosphate hydrolysis family protein [Loktanella gaetbuli]MCB5199511.1 5-bromo-4-chloroindolyl phosphate hydrolysis family protein [Loktanella gaetbuli]
MAQRFGGKFSPGGGTAAPVDRVTVHPVGARANLMFAPPIALVFASLNNGPFVMVTALIAAGLMTAGAWLLRDGLRAQAAYDAREVARRPALPRKIIAAILAGVGVGLAAVTGDTGVAGSIVYGIAATGLHLAAFGIDPLRDKRLSGVDTFQQDRVARVVDEAEAYLTDMTNQIARLRDRTLTARVAAFQTSARRMIRAVEQDPRDLTAARKYLGVYLLGARDATAQFADLAARGPQPAAQADYTALLDDLEQNFTSRTEKLLADDRNAMDIEIKVLRDRLSRER